MALNLEPEKPDRPEKVEFFTAWYAHSHKIKRALILEAKDSETNADTVELAVLIDEDRTMPMRINRRMTPATFQRLYDGAKRIAESKGRRHEVQPTDLIGCYLVLREAPRTHFPILEVERG